MKNEFNRFGQSEEDHLLQRLPPADQAMASRFVQERIALHGDLSRSRVRKIYYSLLCLRKLSPVGYGEMTEEHVIGVLAALKKGEFGPNTIRDMIAVLKPFLKWLVKKKKAPHLTTDFISEIRIPPMESRKIKPEELLTDKEVEDIIKAASPRDRAIISLMADAGLRPIEAGTLRLSDLEFADNTMFVHTKKKTDRPRRIPAPRAMYYVQEWINQAPYTIQGEDLLFRTIREPHNPLMDDALRWCVRDAARRAGVKRYKHPYQFRHGAITRWVDSGLSTAKVSRLSHGGPSKMVESVYWHPDDHAIADELMAKVHGKKVSEKVKANPTTRMCPTCGRIYPLTVRFCTTCGPLTEEARDTLNNKMQIIQAFIAGLTPEEIKEAQRRFRV